MSNPQLFLCNTAKPITRKKDWKRSSPIRLQIGKGVDDVHVKHGHLTSALCTKLTPRAIDLLYVMAYVYTADQMITRGGKREFEYGLKWNRQIRFEIGVREPDFWNQPCIGIELGRILEILTGDHFEFAFVLDKDPMPIEQTLFDPLETNDPGECSEVLMFSGGIDSLVGAVDRILEQKQHVALVSHRPSTNTFHRQKEIVDAINHKLAGKGPKPYHVGVQVNKRRDYNREYTQRSRSFVFATLGSIVAQAFGLNSFHLFENGITSVNLPINGQMPGTKSSRTTHPRVISAFNSWLSCFYEHSFKIETPYFWKTKTDLLVDLKDKGHADLCRLTSSCSHTWQQTTEHPHCGRCSQCLERRFAVLSAEILPEDDPASAYACNVFIQEMAEEDLLLAEGYYSSSIRIRELDRLGFFTEYPDALTTLRHLGLSSEEAATQLWDMVKRNANQIVAGVAKAFSMHSDLFVGQQLPTKCLLNVIGAKPVHIRASARRSIPTASSAEGAGLEFDDGLFAVRFKGEELLLNNSKEFDLAKLLIQRSPKYVTYDTIRAVVWQGEIREKNTIQRTACNLRRKITEQWHEEVDVQPQKGAYRIVVKAI